MPRSSGLRFGNPLRQLLEPGTRGVHALGEDAPLALGGGELLAKLGILGAQVAAKRRNLGDPVYERIEFMNHGADYSFKNQGRSRTKGTFSM